MNQWYRVFGSNDAQPEPAALLAHVHDRGHPVTAQFFGDDQGWYRGEFVAADGVPALQVERYLVTETGIRADLNSWAAWLEMIEVDGEHAPLMQRVVSTKQLFTIRRTGESPAEALPLVVCQFLARETAGVYQVDEQGFFTADGMLLVKEA